MTLSKIETTIRWALIALLSLTVVVACGPQKRKHRMPMKTGLQKGLAQKLTPEQQKKQTENLKNRSAKIEEIDGLIASAKKFDLLDKNSLKDGTYKLDKVIAYFKYMNGAEDVRIYREHGLQNFDLTDIPGSYKATGSAASFSDKGRYLEVPLKFVVDRTQNQDWTAIGDTAFPEVVSLFTQVTQNTKEFTLDLNDKTGSLGERVRASVATMLAGAQFTQGVYTVQDENGKNVELRLLNVSENRLNVSFDIVEAGSQPLQVRTIVLSYAIEKKAATQQEAGSAAQQPATTADGQLAPEQAPGMEQVPGVDL